MLLQPLEFTLAPLQPAKHSCLKFQLNPTKQPKQPLWEARGLAGAGRPLPTSELLSEAMTSLPSPAPA